MSFGNFSGLGVIFLGFLGSEEGPTNEVTSLDSLEPCGFDGEATHNMHPPYGLLGGQKFIHAIGQA